MPPVRLLVCVGREVTYLATGEFKAVDEEPFNSCVCPPSAPVVSEHNPSVCVSHADRQRHLLQLSLDEWRPRIAGDASFHPPHMAFDGYSFYGQMETWWQSAAGVVPVSLTLAFPRAYQVCPTVARIFALI